MDFQILALNVDRFIPLFGLDREALAEAGVQRLVADSKPGFPCRVSLQDAEVGENVLLMNYEHQSKPTPYRSSHAIFVREWASEASPGKNEIPEMFRHRMISVRAFDAAGMMTDADIVEGAYLETVSTYTMQSPVATRQRSSGPDKHVCSWPKSACRQVSATMTATDP